MMREDGRSSRTLALETMIVPLVATEHDLNLLIRRQISAGDTLLDSLPISIREVVARAPLLKSIDKLRQLLLILRRPREHSIKNLFHLICGHGRIITYCACPNTAVASNEAMLHAGLES